METKTRKAATAHKIIEVGEGVLNLVWGKADERRAASLEIIARTAYTAEESASPSGVDSSTAERAPSFLLFKTAVSWILKSFQLSALDTLNASRPEKTLSTLSLLILKSAWLSL